MTYNNTVYNIDIYSKLIYGIKVKIIDTILVLLIILILYLLKRVKFYSDCCKNRFDYQLQNNLMLDAVGYGACTVDNNGRFLSINESALEILGVLKHEILNNSIEAIFYDGILKNDTHTKEECSIFKTIKDKKKRVVKEQIIKKNGTSMHLSLNISPFENNGVVVVFKDITTEVSILQELNQRNIELDKLATTDGLSGLYNRRYFDDNLQIECDRALRGGTSFTLGICDIDSFKLYNDNYGHIKGDEVIHSVSNILKYTFNRQTDIVVSELLNIADSALYKSKENGKI